MRIESNRLDLHNKFIHDYEQGDSSLLDHFDYNPMILMYFSSELVIYMKYLLIEMLWQIP
ncbi:hypothetical protein [Gracilibacillus boraciitolerans]|uniref:hypothetical protein n=1 Tax=Gracilibacillus boraciitolerans TaxID=307521 RepID=UPI000689786F|nr:hypothetical protein [Gracilibacillus boraciitolerans]